MAALPALQPGALRAKRSRHSAAADRTVSCRHHVVWLAGSSQSSPGLQGAGLYLPRPCVYLPNYCLSAHADPRCSQGCMCSCSHVNTCACHMNPPPPARLHVSELHVCLDVPESRHTLTCQGSICTKYKPSRLKYSSCSNTRGRSAAGLTNNRRCGSD